MPAAALPSPSFTRASYARRLGYSASARAVDPSLPQPPLTRWAGVSLPPAHLIAEIFGHAREYTSAHKTGFRPLGSRMGVAYESHDGMRDASAAGDAYLRLTATLEVCVCRAFAPVEIRPNPGIGGRSHTLSQIQRGFRVMSNINASEGFPLSNCKCHSYTDGILAIRPTAHMPPKHVHRRLVQPQHSP